MNKARAKNWIDFLASKMQDNDNLTYFVKPKNCPYFDSINNETEQSDVWQTEYVQWQSDPMRGKSRTNNIQSHSEHNERCFFIDIYYSKDSTNDTEIEKYRLVLFSSLQFDIGISKVATMAGFDFKNWLYHVNGPPAKSISKLLNHSSYNRVPLGIVRINSKYDWLTIPGLCRKRFAQHERYPLDISGIIVFIKFLDISIIIFICRSE